MDSTWVMVLISLFGLMLTVVIPLVAYFNRAMSKNSQLIGEHKTHVAETYATKDDVKDLGDRMERQMKSGFDNLKELLTNRIFRDQP